MASERVLHRVQLAVHQSIDESVVCFALDENCDNNNNKLEDAAQAHLTDMASSYQDPARPVCWLEATSRAGLKQHSSMTMRTFERRI